MSDHYGGAVDFRRPVEAVVPGAQGRIMAVLVETSADLNLRTVARLSGVSIAHAPASCRHWWSSALSSDLDVVFVRPAAIEEEDAKWRAGVDRWVEHARRLAGRQEGAVDAIWSDVEAIVSPIVELLGATRVVDGPQERPAPARQSHDALWMSADEVAPLLRTTAHSLRRLGRRA